MRSSAASTATVETDVPRPENRRKAAAGPVALALGNHHVSDHIGGQTAGETAQSPSLVIATAAVAAGPSPTASNAVARYLSQ
jgi:hypothetical protein